MSQDIPKSYPASKCAQAARPYADLWLIYLIDNVCNYVLQIQLRLIVLILPSCYLVLFAVQPGLKH